MHIYMLITVFLISILTLDAKPIDDQHFDRFSIERHAQPISLISLLRKRRAIKPTGIRLGSLNTGGIRLGSGIGNGGTRLGSGLNSFGIKSGSGLGGGLNNFGLGSNLAGPKIKENFAGVSGLNSLTPWGSKSRFTPTPLSLDKFSPAVTFNLDNIQKISSWTTKPSRWGFHKEPVEGGEGTLIDFGYRTDRWSVGAGPIINGQGEIVGGGLRGEINIG